MIEVNFLDVVKSGQFEPLRFGMSQKDVLNILGTPSGFSNTVEEESNSFKFINYGWFEFHFINDRLCRISNSSIMNLCTFQFDESFHFESDKFKIVSWFKKPNIDTSYKSIKEKFKLEDVKFNETTYYDCLKLTINNNIELDFCCKEIIYKDTSDWINLNRETFDLQLCHFFLSLNKE